MSAIGLGTTRVGSGGGGDIGNVTVNIPPTSNPIEYFETIRLSGDSANIDATPFRSQVDGYDGAQLLNSLTGTEGTTYEINGIYKSIAIEILRQTVQDAELEVNEIGYKAGVGNITDTVLPLHTASPGSYLTQKYNIVAKPGCFVEILIARDNNNPVPVV